MRDTINLAGMQASVLNALKGATVRYAYFPALDPTAVATTSGGKIIAAGDAVWSAAVDIIPAVAGIAIDYWICAITVHAAAGAGMFEVRLQTALAAVLAEFKFGVTAVTTNLGNQDLPFPIFMLADAAVACLGACSAGAIKNIYVGILYATLL